jgi:hypothetical protein
MEERDDSVTIRAGEQISLETMVFFVEAPRRILIEKGGRENEARQARETGAPTTRKC